jgi:hypothetical protein
MIAAFTNQVSGEPGAAQLSLFVEAVAQRRGRVTLVVLRRERVDRERAV